MNIPNKIPLVTASTRKQFCAAVFGVVVLVFYTVAQEGPSVTLTNIAIHEGGSATFVPEVTGTPPISYQWFLNRQPIAGATTETYGVEKALMENHTDLYSVIVSNQFGTATAAAVLSVSPEPPSILSVLNVGAGNLLVVIFSRPVNPQTAFVADNYLVDEMPVVKAQQINERMVALEIKVTAPNRHTLTAKNVKSLVSASSGSTITAEVESGLRFWLRCEEKDTGVALDSSGSGSSATLNDKSMHTEAGKLGAGLHFNGTGDYASFPEGMADFTHGMTVAVWVKPASVKKYSRFLEFANGMRADDNIIFGRVFDSNDFFFEVYDSARSAGKVIAPNAIELGKWQHFAATMDAEGKVKLYKNGDFLREGKTALPKVVPRKNNYLGRSNWPSDTDEFYDGEMDEVRLYGRALSDEEIRIIAEGVNFSAQK